MVIVLMKSDQLIKLAKGIAMKYFIMHTTELDELDLQLHDIIHQGSWTNPIAETFGQSNATHLHFYLPIVEARKAWNDIKHLVPDTVVSLSFDDN